MIVKCQTLRRTTSKGEVEESCNNNLIFKFYWWRIMFNELDYGAYLVSTGDQSSKMNGIIDLIKLRWSDGLLYVTESKNDCDEVYNKITNLTDDSGELIILRGNVLKIQSNFENLNVHPSEIKNKKVVICTYECLLYENLMDSITESFNKAKNGQLVYRKWMILDDLPKKLSFSQSRLILKLIKNWKFTSSNVMIFLDKLGLRYENVLERNNDEIIDGYDVSDDCEVFQLNDVDNIYYPKEYEKLFSYTGKGRCSRNHHLNNRSTQEKLMDLLVRISYFNAKILREVPFINKKSYYLADYYLPDRSLIIELDSDLHDKEMDEIRDEYFKTLGIKVVRFKDFTASYDEINKMKSIINSIKPHNPRIYRFNHSRDLDYSLLGGLKDIIRISDGQNSRFLRRLLRSLLTNDKVKVMYDNSLGYEPGIIKMI